MELTHINEKGNARMVDIGEKTNTRRLAAAEAVVTMKPGTLELIAAGGLPKGDVFSTARIAGVMAAKRTHEIIPMCHPIPIDSIEIEFSAEPPCTARITATVRCTYKTGVEMEALTAASAAALTVYDMCKAVDKTMKFEVRLKHKSGGKSGDFYAEEEDR
jgi:cyclic pyranopterin phosphate synthase